MQTNEDILSLLKEKGAQAAKEMQRALILQPGAIGDCILTLPLVNVMKESLCIGGVDILGHSEYLGILPGRTCVDSVRSMDSIDLHRLFIEPASFDLPDRDPLINVFADYAWIVTFLGEPNGSFEQNLIFTANCSHSAEVITLPLKPPEDLRQHLADFYTQEFINQSGLSTQKTEQCQSDVLMKAIQTDRQTGAQLLKEAGANRSEKLVVMQPGSGGARKCWHLSNFLEIAKSLSSRSWQVVFLLGPAELDRFHGAELRSMGGLGILMKGLSLNEVVGILSCADVFIGNDSGVTHLAAALGVRTVAIFGPTNPTIYRPIGPALTVIQAPVRGFTKKSSHRLQNRILAALLD